MLCLLLEWYCNLLHTTLPLYGVWCYGVEVWYCKTNLMLTPSFPSYSLNPIPLMSSPDCSETFTSPTGELSSPNFPSNYPNNRQCIYKIIVGVNMQIMLNFTDFNMEGSPPNCAFDYVEIR